MQNFQIHGESVQKLRLLYFQLCSNLELHIYNLSYD